MGIGACLATIDEDGEERPVSFLSRKLQSAETRYPAVEKELLAVVFALKKLRKYLLDREFTLFCDNSAVCYLFNKNEPSQRLQRWVMCTQEFKFNVKHIASTKNSVEDALFRFPPKVQDESEDGEDCIEALFEHLLIESEVTLEQEYEDWLLEIFRYFKDPGNANIEAKYKRLALKYQVKENVLYTIDVLVYVMLWFPPYQAEEIF